MQPSSGGRSTTAAWTPRSLLLTRPCAAPNWRSPGWLTGCASRSYRKMMRTGRRVPEKLCPQSVWPVQRLYTGRQPPLGQTSWTCAKPLADRRLVISVPPISRKNSIRRSSCVHAGAASSVADSVHRGVGGGVERPTTWAAPLHLDRAAVQACRRALASEQWDRAAAAYQDCLRAGIRGEESGHVQSVREPRAVDAKSVAIILERPQTERYSLRDVE